jgi:hypothetical protein
MGEGTMSLRVVGAGVGRTATMSLKLALERLLGGRCHHMIEILTHPEEIPAWMDAIEGRQIDWATLTDGYVAQVDWPGASFWPELLQANPDALVLLSCGTRQAGTRALLTRSSRDLTAPTRSSARG